MPIPLVGERRWKSNQTVCLYLTFSYNIKSESFLISRVRRSAIAFSGHFYRTFFNYFFKNYELHERNIRQLDDQNKRKLNLNMCSSSLVSKLSFSLHFNIFQLLFFETEIQNGFIFVQKKNRSTSSRLKNS